MIIRKTNVSSVFTHVELE